MTSSPLRFAVIAYALPLVACARPATPVARAAGQSARPAGAIALEDVTVIDGTGTAPARNRTILIRDGRIADVFPTGSRRLPAGTQRLKLPGRFVIPGLVDAHVHVTTPFTTRPRQDSILSF